jgi:hypothetical protein
LIKVCLWHLLEQGILDLRHEHHIALHFPAHLHVESVKAELNSIDSNLLLEISHIQACQKNWTVNETANLVSTCNFAG